jgi:predicted dehydrogenase
MTKDPHPIRWGILGTGHIAKRFHASLQAEKDSSLIAVASRTLARAQEFQASFPVEKSHGTYDALLEDESIEAVYLALPNHLHSEWVLKAIQHGKHVLCEKPITANAQEAEALFDAARSSNVCLMEGFLYRYHPQTEALVQLLKQGVIGDVQRFQMDFSFDMGLDYGNIRLSRAFAGGSIMDVGCYCVSMARLLAGAAVQKPFLEPTQVRGLGLIDPRSGVDLWAAATLHFETGLEAVLTCSTQTVGEKKLRIFGSNGMILVENPWKPQPSDTMQIRYFSDSFSETPLESIQHGATLNAFQYEVRYFQSCIRNHQQEATSPGMSWADSLGNMRVLDAWRENLPSYGGGSL